MGLLTKTIEHVSKDGTRYKLVVSEASIQIGTRRFRLGEDARQAVQAALDNGNPLSVEAAWDITTVYPNLVAATVKGEVVEASGQALAWPPSFDEFLAFPEALWDKWAEAVRKLNPHWYPEETPPDPKEPTPSTSG